MKLLWICALALALMPLLIGCNERNVYTLRVTDSHGNPVSGAKVCVWSYPVDQQHPVRSVAEIGRTWEDGELTMRGWFFYSDKTGLVTCTGFPTGKEVVDSYRPGRVVYRPEIGVVVRKHGRWRHETVVVGERAHYIPPKTQYRWQRGDWLAVTVTSPGYAPTHFAFRPDGKEGDMGTIEVKAMDR
ncbi:MAG: Ig-like domain-containing protein [Armatimonadota bacterium]